MCLGQLSPETGKTKADVSSAERKQVRFRIGLRGIDHPLSSESGLLNCRARRNPSGLRLVFEIRQTSLSLRSTFVSIWTSIASAWKILWHGRGHDVAELARRLDVDVKTLKTTPTKYWWHRIPKPNGGRRLLHSPNPALKALQRKLLRKVFRRLKVHPAAKGFRRGESVVTHARLHVGRTVVIRIDIRNFFWSTHYPRLYAWFRKIGWNRSASAMLTRLTTHPPGSWRSGLPQGAPTSPILTNLVNYRMDVRLAGLARRSGAIYSRYADDIIFSFEKDDRRFIRGVVRRVRRILASCGYRMHGRPKLKWMRRHQPQTITGLVVNERIQLPRRIRRWLRAIEHHMKTGRPATLTPQQLAGWKAWQQMIERQSGRKP